MIFLSNDEQRKPLSIEWVRHSGKRFCQTTLVLTALILVGCDKGQQPKASKDPRVFVTEPITDVVMDYQDFTGRLDAVKTIDIRARVSGYVVEIPFKEGDVVKENALLFQIDKRPYQADLNQAEANLKVAIAEMELQIKNAERAKTLFPANAISKEDLDTVMAAQDKAEANVGAMRAAKERAQLYLDYTSVTAPVTGRVSRRYVDPGNLINADSTILTRIVTENPMFAYFDVDERTYLDLLATLSPGKTSWYEGLNFPVMMRLANEKDFDKVGMVNFVDNQVVATTGTVRMRGVFDNSQGMLKAGLFVRIRLPIGSPYRASIIPDEAILSDQERKYVWLVNAKSEVEYRPVKLKQPIKDLRVIQDPGPGQAGKEGVAPGDRIIISGMQRVRQGLKVDAENQAPPSLPEMPLVKLWERGKQVDLNQSPKR